MRDDDIPRETNTAAMSVLVTQDARGAHLVWCKELGQLVLVHRLGQVGDVKVGVALVGEGLQLRVERFAGEADFVTKVVEAANAVLGVLVVVVLDEAEAGRRSAEAWTMWSGRLHTPCKGQCSGR